MLYVEGDDDISFWHLQFNRYISEKEYEIQKVDGKENLDPYINGILNGDMENIVVACDSDYTEFQEGQLSHICIVRTYGHSIENTMFCPVYVAKYLRKFTKTTTDYTQDIRSWFENFCNSANCLLPYEIKNTLWFWQIRIDMNVPNVLQRCWIYSPNIDFLHRFEFFQS